MFRRVMNQPVQDHPSTELDLGDSSPGASQPDRAPGLLILLGTALVAGIASGFLELVVIGLQVQVLHRVDWSSLMVNRHITWMLPVTAPLVIVPLTTVLVSPVLAWAVWRRQAKDLSLAMPWIWGWAGTVLGMLSLLGPLLAIRVLHPAAPIALALGLGFRLRRWFVRPTAGWWRLSSSGAGIALFALPLYGFSQWNSVVRGPERVGSRPASDAPNLLWIVIDTLRADRMSVYGYGQPTTPELEAWAKEGITFDMARSAAPWTLPSHVTMFTGLWPFEHSAGVDRAYFGPSPTLAEHLRGKGYQTAGIVANVRMCNASYGVGRGFDHYVDYPCNQEISLRAMMYNSALGSAVMELGRRVLLPLPGPFPFGFHRRAREITADGRSWLDSLDRNQESGARQSRRPFFLFLNLMDVHGPYLPAPDAIRRFWTAPIPPQDLASPGSGWKALRTRDTATPDQRRQRQHEVVEVSRRLGDLYDECLHGLDAELGRFLGELRTAGLLAKTWVVITADHGEHFGEHDHFGHGSSLYNEQTHVPLILIPPLGAESAASDDPAAALRGRRCAVPVSLRDLPRTMSDLLLPAADNPFPGHSLARHWGATEPESADPVLSQLEEPRLAGEDFATDQVLRVNSVIEDDYILIESSRKPPELYSLFADPKQQRNLADHPDQGSRLEHMRCTLSALRSAPSPL
jgi:arylsulfatase A-like enzyme